jgi:hypothetical protein
LLQVRKIPKVLLFSPDVRPIYDPQHPPLLQADKMKSPDDFCGHLGYRKCTEFLTTYSESLFPAVLDIFKIFD